MLGGIAWVALAQPHASCFIPFFPTVTRLSPEFQTGRCLPIFLFFSETLVVHRLPVAVPA